MDSKTFETVKDVMISLWYLKGWSEATAYIDLMYEQHMVSDEQYLALNDRVNELGDGR